MVSKMPFTTEAMSVEVQRTQTIMLDIKRNQRFCYRKDTENKAKSKEIYIRYTYTSKNENTVVSAISLKCPAFMETCLDVVKRNHFQPVHRSNDGRRSTVQEVQAAMTDKQV